MKIAFVIALIGFVIGFIKGKDAFYRNDYVSGVLAGFCGFFLLPAFCAILFLIVCGIGWLFT